MAATKIHLIKTILRKIIDDVCNGDKTDDKIYITDTPVQRRKNANIPKNNHEYWKNKLEGNVERDKKNYVKLESMGIKVTVVWECEIKQMSKDKISLEDHIVNILCEITNHI